MAEQDSRWLKKVMSGIAHYKSMSDFEQNEFNSLLDANGIKIEKSTLSLLTHRSQEFVEDFLSRNYKIHRMRCPFDLKKKLAESGDYHLIVKFAAGLHTKKFTRPDIDSLNTLIKNKTGVEYSIGDINELVNEELAVLIENETLVDVDVQGTSFRDFVLILYKKLVPEMEKVVLIAVRAGFAETKYDFKAKIVSEMSAINSEILESKLNEDTKLENALRETLSIYSEIVRLLDVIKSNSVEDVAGNTDNESARRALESLEGGKVPVSNDATHLTEQRTPSASQFDSFLNGEMALVKTYWLYNMVPNFVASFLLRAASASHGATLIITIISTAYLLVSLLAVWKSAGKYQGPSIWSVLARISVCSQAVFTAIAMLGLLTRP